MSAPATLLQFLLMVVAGWLHRQQAAAIEYLSAENRLPRERTILGMTVIVASGLYVTYHNLLVRRSASRDLS